MQALIKPQQIAAEKHKKTQPPIAQMSDEQLVELINLLDHRHHAASNELMERFRPGVYRRCRLQLGNSADAEDATQIILHRVYEKLHLYRGEAKFSSWLNRIVDTQCINFYHAQKRHRLLHEPGDRLDEVDDSHDHHLQLETTESVNWVLGKMTSTQNEILRLRFYSELTLRQIADKLGLSLSAVKARLYRSLEKFQSLYNRTIETGACAMIHTPA